MIISNTPILIYLVFIKNQVIEFGDSFVCKELKRPQINCQQNHNL